MNDLLHGRNLLKHDGEGERVTGWGMRGGRGRGGRRDSGHMLVGRMFAIWGRQLAGTAAAEGGVRAIGIQGALHGHGAALRVPPYSVGGEFSGVNACWVCLQTPIVSPSALAAPASESAGQEFVISHLISQRVHYDAVRHQSERVHLPHQHVGRDLVELDVLQEVAYDVLQRRVGVVVAILLPCTCKRARLRQLHGNSWVFSLLTPHQGRLELGELVGLQLVSGQD